MYCIDTSGSMNGERLNSVKNTVLTQLKVLEDTKPKCKVCLVEFENSVIIHGDCTSEPITVSGNVIYQYDSLVDVAKEHMELHDIKDTIKQLTERVASLHTKGCTALGPGLLISTVIAKKTGGKVILCTDGMANEGLGRLEYNNSKDSIEFYNRVSNEAKEGGVTAG